MQHGSLNLSIEDVVPPIVRASGVLDAESSGFFESALRDVLRQHSTGLDLALGDVTFVDSSGLRALVAAAMVAQNAGCRINISSMSAHLDHMLSLAGFRHLFTIFGADQQVPEPTMPPQVSSEPCCVQVAKGPGACRVVRDKVCQFARQMGFEPMAVEDIRLAVGEAVSNAVRHGAQEDGEIDMRCDNQDGTLAVKITYPSAVFDPSAIPIPNYSTAAEGGMGIYFMRIVMDKVQYDFLEGSTILTLEKALPHSS